MVSHSILNKALFCRGSNVTVFTILAARGPFYDVSFIPVLKSTRFVLGGFVLIKLINSKPFKQQSIVITRNAFKAIELFTIRKRTRHQPLN